MTTQVATSEYWPGSHGRALLCPYEHEDPAFRRAGRLPNLRYGDQVRAVWVTRYDFQSEADISRIMRHCAETGFNTVFFQVRGNATTYYPSKLEPWSEVYGWQSPGFDPLLLAIGEAHSHNIALHAWINVMPMWRGSTPPANKDQMYWSHPEWSWYDCKGVRQPLNRGFYVSLNPCLPEARDHIVGLCREIVSCYGIDGLHLDYIRFPNEPPVLNGKEYPCDKRTRDLFEIDTGFTTEERPDLWDKWRCDCVTALLRDIRCTAKSIRPQLVLTAAVGAEQKAALSKFQDVEKWWSERLLDAVVPMNYTNCQSTFRRRVEHDWLENSTKRVIFPLNRLLSRLEQPHRTQNKHCPPQLVKDDTLIEWAPLPEPAIVMGTSVEFGNNGLHLKQLALALQQFGHFSVFCYSSLFGQRKEKRHQSLVAYMRILADASSICAPLNVQSEHPFRRKDTFTHPEEAFPYDQLPLYSGVSTLKQERPDLLLWRPRRKGRRFTSGVECHERYSRRTVRRKLLLKDRKKGSIAGKALEQRSWPLLNREEVFSGYLGLDNCEALKMSEATEEQFPLSQSVKESKTTSEGTFRPHAGDPPSGLFTDGFQSNKEKKTEAFPSARNFKKAMQSGSNNRVSTTAQSPLCWISSFLFPSWISNQRDACHQSAFKLVGFGRAGDSFCSK